jgi:hypothetical protein
MCNVNLFAESVEFYPAAEGDRPASSLAERGLARGGHAEQEGSKCQFVGAQKGVPRCRWQP